MNNILAAIDFSEVSERVVEAAAKIARTFGSKLWIVHAAAPDPDFVGYEAGPQTVRDSRAAKLRDEHRKLEQFAERCQADGIDCVALLVQGPSAQTVLSKAAEVGAKLIVVGSHGRGALYNLMVGSVAGTLLRDANLPVLVIPSKKA